MATFFEEKQGNLFNSSDSLAHCVSVDLKMSKGIADIFRRKFGGIDILRSQDPKIGKALVLQDNERYILYLVTKQRYWQKPTYDNLRLSLEDALLKCKEYGITHLAMPRIGSGLDNLEWQQVKNIIMDIFNPAAGIHVTVWTIQI